MSTNLSNLVNSYFLIMFFIGFTIMGIDKWKAINSRWRIPEKQLWLIACIGGAAGTWLGMIIFRHKIRHNHFVYGFTMLTFIEGFILYAL